MFQQKEFYRRVSVHQDTAVAATYWGRTTCHPATLPENFSSLIYKTHFVSPQARLPPRPQSKSAFCFLLSLSAALHVGVDYCGGHQVITPSVPFILRLCLSFNLCIRVYFGFLLHLLEKGQILHVSIHGLLRLGRCGCLFGHVKNISAGTWFIWSFRRWSTRKICRHKVHSWVWMQERSAKFICERVHYIYPSSPTNPLDIFLARRSA